MAGEIGAIFIGVYADVTKARKGMADITEDVKKTQKAVEKTAGVWDGFLGQLAKIGLAAHGVETLARTVQGLASIPISLAVSAEDDARSLRQLGYYMDQLGGQAGTSTAAVEAQIASLSDLTGLAKGELRGGFQDLLRQYGSVELAQDRLTAAVDLMATGYGDLRTSIHGLNAAFDSVALRRGFATFTGAARRESTEATSVFKKFQLAITELKEAIGKSLLPILTGAAEGLTKAVQGITNAWKIMFDDLTGPQFTTLSDLWKKVFGTEIPGALKAVTDGISGVWNATTKFIDDLGSAKTKEDVRKAIESYIKNVKDVFTEQRTKLGEELDKLGLIGLALKLAPTLGTMAALGFGLNEIVQAILALPGAIFFAGKIAGSLSLPITLGLAFGLTLESLLPEDVKKDIKANMESNAWWAALLGIAVTTAVIASGGTVLLGVAIGAALSVAVSSVNWSAVTDIPKSLMGWADEKLEGVQMPIAIAMSSINWSALFNIPNSLTAWVGEKLEGLQMGIAIVISSIDWSALIDIPKALKDWLAEKLGGLADLVNPRAAVPPPVVPPPVVPAPPPRTYVPPRPPDIPPRDVAFYERELEDLSLRRRGQSIIDRIEGVTKVPDLSISHIAVENKLIGVFDRRTLQTSFMTPEELEGRYRDLKAIAGATGFDGIVAGPRAFIAGDGSEPERVTITPMSKERMNRRGPRGGHTFNLNVGSVDSSDRVYEIQRAQARLIRLYGS